VRIHATHAIATVDVAFDLIEDPETSADAAVVIMARILRDAPADLRKLIGGALVHKAIQLIDHVQIEADADKWAKELGIDLGA
jgi:hypothetical protein